MSRPMLLPIDRVQQGMLLGFLAFLFASCLNPPYPDYLLMQHVPTALAALTLALVASRHEVSRLSFLAIVAFLCLHTLGARYLYSYVPYDAWSRRLLGTGVNEALGFERNHYDRLVHFSYGLLLALPVQEFERRHLRFSFAMSSVLAVECILATSAAYELIEWLVAVVYSPDWADKFLGQQGDMFDAQKDMALATAGAVLSIGVFALASRRQSVIGRH